MAENSVRPSNVTLIAVAQFFTGLVVLIVLLACGAGFIMAPIQDAKSGPNWSLLFGVTAIMIGLVVGSAMLWAAWAFFQLNPRAYRFVHAEASRPQFLLMPLFKSRLDEEEMQAAFGVHHSVDATDVLAEES